MFVINIFGEAFTFKVASQVHRQVLALLGKAPKIHGRDTIVVEVNSNVCTRRRELMQGILRVSGLSRRVPY
jgi:hypothetical protein